MKVDARKAGLPLYVRAGKPVDFDTAAQDGSGKLKGVGLSGGVTTGRARIVPDLAEIGRVEQDDILICNATDPGWTSVFTLIKGLVIETGGMLAHGACLSREHGIPAVQLRSAMQIIPDGAMVRLRGETGEIELVSE
jgi:pyruvate,water dikinase